MLTEIDCRSIRVSPDYKRSTALPGFIPGMKNSLLASSKITWINIILSRECASWLGSTMLCYGAYFGYDRRGTGQGE